MKYEKKYDPNGQLETKGIELFEIRVVINDKDVKFCLACEERLHNTMKALGIEEQYLRLIQDVGELVNSKCAIDIIDRINQFQNECINE